MVDLFANLKKGSVPVPSPPPSAAVATLDRLAKEKRKNDPVAKEIDRIVGLPLVREVTAEEVEWFNRENVLSEAYNKGFRLFPEQVGAVLAYDLYDGAFLPIGVGRGKTIISLMIAERASRRGIKKTLLLVPSQVYLQLVNRDIPWARRRVPLSTQFLPLGNTSAQRRQTFACSDLAGCYILPYSCLSTKDASDVLSRILPGLIIADEAHNLKNSTAARTKRIRRLIEHSEPQLVAMSGTITSRSIVDYWHLIRACLRDNCPLPLSSHIVRQWGQVIDADSSGWSTWEGPSDWQIEPIMPLVDWAKKHFPAEEFPESVRGFRRAYKLRLNTAPGVVSSGDATVGTSLVMSNQEAATPAPGWTELEELMEGVLKDWKSPSGDEIDHAIQQFSWLYQLTAGFYNDLYWPEPKNDEEAEALERAQYHHALQQRYHSDLRKWLGRRAKPGLDTPFLVGQDMHRYADKNVGPDLYESWCDMRAAEFEGMPERLSRPIRVCSYKIDHAVAWAASELPKGVGAILWVHHQEIGKWLAEELQCRGAPVLHCPAGPHHNEAITDPANGNRIIVASIAAHGTGKNLQHFQHQFVMQWPRSAVAAEQMLGRLHRTGQLADELVVVTNNTTEIDDLNFAACLNDALYIHDSTGVRQKLMFCSYETPPVVFDHATLRAAGLDPKKLTGEQVLLLKEKFGEQKP